MNIEEAKKHLNNLAAEKAKYNAEIDAKFANIAEIDARIAEAEAVLANEPRYATYGTTGFCRNHGGQSVVAKADGVFLRDSEWNGDPATRDQFEAQFRKTLRAIIEASGITEQLPTPEEVAQLMMRIPPTMLGPEAAIAQAIREDRARRLI